MNSKIDEIVEKWHEHWNNSRSSFPVRDALVGAVNEVFTAGQEKAEKEHEALLRIKELIPQNPKLPLIWEIKNEVDQALQQKPKCPLCGADTFVDTHCPATDHPETTMEYDFCTKCDWSGNGRHPVMNPHLQTETKER